MVNGEDVETGGAVFGWLTGVVNGVVLGDIAGDVTGGIVVRGILPARFPV